MNMEQTPITRSNELALKRCDIVILVPGTVDPINLSPSSRANSFNKAGHEDDWYWADDEGFNAFWQDIKQRFFNIHIFNYFGWSGDNSRSDREQAGRYLADRLCDEVDGHLPFYQKYLKWKVSFHLIGHSHGGNVINEFTKRIATGQSKWPETWKIKSITYLSTPFFKKIHQLNTSKLDPKCVIFNIRNQYDLTQRVIADFTLKQMLEIVNRDGGRIWEVIGEILSVLKNHAGALDAIERPNITDVFNLEKNWKMKPEAAEELYKTCYFVLIKTNELIAGLLTILDNLNASPILGSKLTTPIPHLVSRLNNIKALIKQILNNIDHRIPGIATTYKDITNPATASHAIRNTRAHDVTHRAHDNMPKVVKKDDFLVFDFIDDLMIENIIQEILGFIDINESTLKGPMTEQVCEVIEALITDYDNTTASIENQIGAKAIKCINIEVDKVDDYSRCPESSNFKTYIRLLEGYEAGYTPTVMQRTNLLNLIFTMVANVEPVSKYVSLLQDVLSALGKLKLAKTLLELLAPIAMAVAEAATSVLLNEKVKTLIKFVEMLRNIADKYVSVLSKRHYGIVSGQNFVIVKTTDLQDKKVYLGDLSYLMVNAHSVSRKEYFNLFLKSQRPSSNNSTSPSQPQGAPASGDLFQGYKDNLDKLISTPLKRRVWPG